MSIHPDHHRLEASPPWTVQAVFDPDGLGGDFAYTIGLFDLGCPELHIYGRPSLGDDPGADWKFSSRDCCRLLNELGAQLVRGQLGVGSRFERLYDGGHVRVAFQVDPPGDRVELEAYGVPPWVDVLPVRWSLHRAPEGEAGPLAPRAEAEARHEYDALVAGLTSEATHPAWWLPERVTFSPEQRYGPRTPVVLGRAAQLWQASERTLANLLAAGGHVWLATGTLTFPTAHARSLARGVGRSAQVEQLVHDAEQLVNSVARTPGIRERWQRAMAAEFSDDFRKADPEALRSLHANLLGYLRDVIVSQLCVEAVADIADPELLLFGRGPAMWAAGGIETGIPPGGEWLAGEEVTTALDTAVSRLSRRQLADVGRAHERASALDDGSEPSYPGLQVRLLGWAMVSAAALPDLSLGGTRYVPAGLQRWGCGITSALTHRARLTAEEVACLAAPLRDVLPELEAVLNRPIVKEPRG